MYIRQVSIFLANKSGTLAEVTDFLYQHNVNLRALCLADTADFGILRIIVDKPEETLALLKEAQYVCTITDMLAVKIDDVPGSMAGVVRALADNDISIEYAYAFTTAQKGTAINLLRVENNAAAEFVLKNTPYQTVGPEVLNA
ncbi:MAG: acetolactate synthase [Oscillospiraceae bacterium]|nr:acetolactate synthase [Oscillospiraceae bacterium]